MKAFKGFTNGMTCFGGFKYKENEEYTAEGPIELCENGFHSCLNPLNVFFYYSPFHQQVYHEVEIDGDIIDEENENKVVSSKIKINKELSFSEMVKQAVGYFWNKMSVRSLAPSRGDNPENIVYCDDTARPVAVAKDKDHLVRTDVFGGVAVALDHSSIAETTCPLSEAISSSPCSAALATGINSLALVKGSCSVAVTTGCNSIAITQQDESTAVAEGEFSIGISTGFRGDVIVKDKGSLGIAWSGSAAKSDSLHSWLLLSDGEAQINDPSRLKLIFIDGEKYKPHTWYTLIDGEVRAAHINATQ